MIPTVFNFINDFKEDFALLLMASFKSNWVRKINAALGG